MRTLTETLTRKRAFRGRLVRWYEANRRDLPWRKTRDPYRIWVSEIMLQQTRVNAVLGHYRRFLTQFPNVDALARASEGDVLAAWSGLGYYRRARMMREAAQEIVAQHGGKFPETEKALRELRGIGRYTAAAVASIAFDEPMAVVDGNVERVIERLAGKQVPAEQAWRFAQEMLPAERPGDFNQAMMELGAMICTPQSPQCPACPVREFCRSRGKLVPKQGRAERRRAVVHLLFARRREKVFLVQRAASAALMAGMWELPEAHPNGAKPLLQVRHAITTTDYEVFVHGHSAKNGQGQWVPERKLDSLPLTGLARKVLVRLGVIASRG